MDHIEQKTGLQDKVTRVIVTTLKLTPDAFTMETALEDLAEDSIKLFELVLAFEKEFGMKAKYEELISIETVGDIVAYLEKQNVA
jgi:acyl carrier protein